MTHSPALAPQPIAYTPPRLIDRLQSQGRRILLPLAYLTKSHQHMSDRISGVTYL